MNYNYSRSYDRAPRRVGWIFAGLLAAVLGFLIYLGISSYYGDDHHSACVVSEKDRVHTDSGSEMRIYTDNCGVFVVSDSLIKTDFRSSDRYSKIKVGQTYDITSYGWRVGLFSMFPSITEATPVK